MKILRLSAAIAALCTFVALPAFRVSAERLSDTFNEDAPYQASASQSQPSSKPTSSGRFFTDEAAFLRAAGKVTVEGFESFPPGTCVTGPAQGPDVTFVTAGFSAVIQTFILYPGSTETVFLCAGGVTSDPAPIPPEGSSALIAGSETGSTYNVLFFLNAPTHAVAFNYEDVAERIGVPVELAGNGNFEFFVPGDGTTVSTCCSGPHEGFFGYVSKTTFSVFLVRTQGRQDSISLDRIQLGKRSK
jgi:hypothetical protein